MIGCGTTTFTDPDDYPGSMPEAAIDLVLTSSERFRARVTWVNLRRLSLVCLEESVPRIASIALAPTPLFVSFPLGRTSPPIWNGRPMQRGEMVLHGRGEHFHQRTTGPCHWGMASLAPEDFAKYSRALLGTEVATPAAMRILRPSRGAVGDFLRLHKQACRLAQTKPDTAAHPVIVRALEQGLVHALINCLPDDEPPEPAGAWQHHSEIILQFEQALAARQGRSLPLPELCAILGVAERTLRICCAQLLGMSPLRYARLRRLNLVRSALLRANPKASTVATIARTYGFSELGRFAVAYRTVFGETPSATLRRAGYLATDAAEFA